ncbi:hypothetical protein SNK04_013835 [Fusarium graminearum]
MAQRRPGADHLGRAEADARPERRDVAGADRHRQAGAAGDHPPRWQRPAGNALRLEGRADRRVRGGNRMGPGLRGGVVMLGARTSKYSRRKMGDFLTFIHAEFSDRVRWSDSSVEKLAQFAPPSRRVA